MFRIDPQGVAGEQRRYLPIAFECSSICTPRVVRRDAPLELIYQSSINHFCEPVSDPHRLRESIVLSNHDPRNSFPMDKGLEVRPALSARSEISLKATLFFANESR